MTRDRTLPGDAGRGARFLGALIDIALMLVPYGGGIAVSVGVDGSPEAYGLALAMPLVVAQAILVSWRGQSVGKLVVRTRIERADGQRVGFVHGVLLRSWLMAWLNGASLVFLLDSLFIFGRRRRCLHDWLADTRVVRILPHGSPR